MRPCNLNCSAMRSMVADGMTSARRRGPNTTMPSCATRGVDDDAAFAAAAQRDVELDPLVDIAAAHRSPAATNMGDEAERRHSATLLGTNRDGKGAGLRRRVGNWQRRDVAPLDLQQGDIVVGSRPTTRAGSVLPSAKVTWTSASSGQRLFSGDDVTWSPDKTAAAAAGGGNRDDGVGDRGDQRRDGS